MEFEKVGLQGFLKEVVDVMLRRDAGREFHCLGAASEKARSPKVFVGTRGTERMRWSLDVRRFRAGV